MGVHHLRFIYQVVVRHALQPYIISPTPRNGACVSLVIFLLIQAMLVPINPVISISINWN